MSERNTNRDVPDMFDDIDNDIDYHRDDYRSEDISDINLSALSAMDYDDGDEDIDEIIAQQSFDNRRAMIGFSSAPAAVALVPDPIDLTEKPNSDPGDNSWMKGLFALIASLLMILVIGFIFGAWYDPGDNTRDVALNGPVTVTDGEIIQPGAAPTADRSGTGANEVQDDDVRVPEGGSLIRYRIEVEGDVSAASVAYIDASGDQESETGITAFPWSEAIGMRDTINPQIAVNSAGYGTITCVIIQDGEDVAEKTVSGENPSVECSV